jgi:hypothetical protein
VFSVQARLHVVDHQVRDGADVISNAGGVAILKYVPHCVEEVARVSK